MATHVELSERTGQTCAHCSRDIFLYEAIVILDVVFLSMNDDGLEASDLTDDDDGYLYEPFTFHNDCWSELHHDQEERMKDVKPIGCAGSILECEICASDIMRDETTAQLRHGTLTISVRQPNHERAFCLRPGQEGAIYLCIECLVGINEVAELWEDINHDNECEEGRRERCWRTGCETRCKRAAPPCRACASDNTEFRLETQEGRQARGVGCGPLYRYMCCDDCGMRQLVGDDNRID